MTFNDLARTYLDEDGIGEATVLSYFEYRQGFGIDDLAEALADSAVDADGLTREEQILIYACNLSGILRRRQ